MTRCFSFHCFENDTDQILNAKRLIFVSASDSRVFIRLFLKLPLCSSYKPAHHTNQCHIEKKTQQEYSRIQSTIKLTDSCFGVQVRIIFVYYTANISMHRLSHI